MIGRIRRWLVGSDDERHNLARAVRHLGEAQREQTNALVARLTAVAERIEQRSTQKDAAEILHAVRALGTGLGRDPDKALTTALDAIAKSSGRIVVGPWTGEVGFEMLYWVPFVEWFRTRWNVDAERLIIVSRGGTGHWYGASGSRYTDILSIVTPDAFRQKTDPDEHKQREMLPFDREIVDAVSQAHGLSEPATLHPSHLYRALAPFWRDEAGFGLVERYTRHRQLAPFDHPATGPLPPEYVAVRFYFSDSFPDTAANRAFARAAVTALARSAPVVILNPGARLDDHADLSLQELPNVITLPSSLPAEENLAVQTAVIARARVFVGTYGGLAYVAPFYGVPSVAYYSDRAFKLHHLHVAQRALERLGRVTVTAVDTSDARFVAGDRS